MEHRQYSRVPTDIKVTLYHNRIPAVSCRAINISPGGLFVASKAMIYPRKTLLETLFQLPSDTGTERFIMWATVAYGCENGMGLTFLETDTDIFHILKQLPHHNERDMDLLNNSRPMPFLSTA